MGYKIVLTGEQVASLRNNDAYQIMQYLTGRRDEIYCQRADHLISNLFDRHPLGVELSEAVSLLQAALAKLPKAYLVELLDQFEDRVGHLYAPVEAVRAANPLPAEPAPAEMNVQGTQTGRLSSTTPNQTNVGSSAEQPPVVFGANDTQTEWELDPETSQYHPAGTTVSDDAEDEDEDEDEDSAVEDDDEDDEDDDDDGEQDADNGEWELDNETGQYHPA